MKMAKASEADMEMAIKVCSALEAIDRRFFPEGSEGSNDPDDFDLDDDEHCGRVLRHIHELMQAGSIGRVIWGMYVLLDPENELIDPDADTLEPHPDIAQAEIDAKRYRAIRRGQAWSVIDGIGDDLRGDALDAAIDAREALNDQPQAKGD